MKTKKYLKGIMGVVSAVALIFGAFVPIVKVNAMEGSPRVLVELRYITRDGVRLHKEGKADSTVLGLMYKNNEINYYTDELGEDPDYVYMTRSDDPSKGYVYKYYTSNHRV